MTAHREAWTDDLAAVNPQRGRIRPEPSAPPAIPAAAYRAALGGALVTVALALLAALLMGRL